MHSVVAGKRDPSSCVCCMFSNVVTSRLCLPTMQIKQWWQAAKQSRQSLSRQLSVALQIEAGVGGVTFKRPRRVSLHVAASFGALTACTLHDARCREQRGPQKARGNKGRGNVGSCRNRDWETETPLSCGRDGCCENVLQNAIIAISPCPNSWAPGLFSEVLEKITLVQ